MMKRCEREQHLTRCRTARRVLDRWQGWHERRQRYGHSLHGSLPELHNVPCSEQGKPERLRSKNGATGRFEQNSDDHTNNEYGNSDGSGSSGSSSSSSSSNN